MPKNGQLRRVRNERTPQFRAKEFKALTDNQRLYLKSLKNYPVVVCHGYPGTGKTWMAVGHALTLLDRMEIDKIIICRPMLEAGEKLGFLPGGIEDKASPYVRPVMEALGDFASPKDIAGYKSKKIVEVIPLAYMKGLTFKNSYIIADEFQNATVAQAKMLVSRIGVGSRMVICGDESQSDLPTNGSVPSGLKHCIERLSRPELTEHVAMVKMGKDDIVRSSLVQLLVVAME